MASSDSTWIGLPIVPTDCSTSFNDTLCSDGSLILDRILPRQHFRITRGHFSEDAIPVPVPNLSPYPTTVTPAQSIAPVQPSPSTPASPPIPPKPDPYILMYLVGKDLKVYLVEVYYQKNASLGRTTLYQICDNGKSSELNIMDLNFTPVTAKFQPQPSHDFDFYINGIINPRKIWYNHKSIYYP